MSRGQIQIATLGLIASVIAGIGAPFIWGGKISAVNDVQDAKIQSIEKSQEEIKQNVEYIRRVLEQMSAKQGIKLNE